ncbi:hypothetical protein PR048_020459 [Dryococelus australis]|uniref:Uncharacterized protein n=1 Tax=Dryococelus australis TaxID=614101 RepID=A0ABQ9H6C1_9NEOP|nr:hypothetical protein PR048_020459 [Dryococelus australis]
MNATLQLRSHLGSLLWDGVELYRVRLNSTDQLREDAYLQSLIECQPIKRKRPRCRVDAPGGPREKPKSRTFKYILSTSKGRVQLLLEFDLRNAVYCALAFGKRFSGFESRIAAPSQTASFADRSSLSCETASIARRIASHRTIVEPALVKAIRAQGPAVIILRSFFPVQRKVTQLHGGYPAVGLQSKSGRGLSLLKLCLALRAFAFGCQAHIRGARNKELCCAVQTTAHMNFSRWTKLSSDPSSTNQDNELQLFWEKTSGRSMNRYSFVTFCDLLGLTLFRHRTLFKDSMQMEFYPKIKLSFRKSPSLLTLSHKDTHKYTRTCDHALYQSTKGTSSSVFIHCDIPKCDNCDSIDLSKSYIFIIYSWGLRHTKEAT